MCVGECVCVGGWVGGWVLWPCCNILCTCECDLCLDYRVLSAMSDLTEIQQG